MQINPIKAVHFCHAAVPCTRLWQFCKSFSDILVFIKRSNNSLSKKVLLVDCSRTVTQRYTLSGRRGSKSQMLKGNPETPFPAPFLALHSAFMLCINFKHELVYQSKLGFCSLNSKVTLGVNNWYRRLMIGFNGQTFCKLAIFFVWGFYEVLTGTRQSIFCFNLRLLLLLNAC